MCAWCTMNPLTTENRMRGRKKLALYYTVILPLLTLLYHLPLKAQTCKSSVPVSTPLSRFQINDNGTTTDRRTGLIWMRCSMGQSWNGKSCSGRPLKFNWLQAAEKAKNSSFAKRKWRLASVTEMSAIIELQCENPAINQTLFPNTPGFHYWTATAFTNQEASHWLIQFRSGENHTDKDTALAFVRLVGGS